MSHFAPPVDPTASLYSSRLRHAATDLAILAGRAVNAPDIRNYLQYLHFYARRIQSTLPKDGTPIGSRWAQKYRKFFGMVEDLRHPELDDDLDVLWVSLPEPI